MVKFKENKQTDEWVVPKLRFLSEEQVEMIKDTAFKILSEIGVKIESEEVFHLLADTPGVTADAESKVVKLSAQTVLDSIALAPKTYSVYGRDHTRHVTFGQGNLIFKSTPADPYWAEAETKTWRPGTIEDMRQAIDLSDALPNIDIVGAMVEPSEIPVPVRAVHMMSELVKRTRKPVRVWTPERNSARFMVEIMKTVAGGDEALRRYPMMHHSLEPISPLRYSTGLGAASEYAKAGLPIIIGPIVQAMLTGPATLAGTAAQCVAENLAGVVIIQRICPGTPVSPAASAHSVDPRTMNIVYGSPEQGLLCAAITQVIKSFDLPVYANAGYCDSKIPDAQAMLEKGMPLLMAALSGADSFAHMGVAGTMGASLLQLVIDDEMVGHLRRMMRGIKITPKTLAFDVIKRVGIGGEFITDEHTAKHWREEYWLPAMSDRETHEVWLNKGGGTMLERASQRRDQLLRDHQPEWLDKETRNQVDDIVAAAEHKLLGEGQKIKQ